MPSIGKVAHPLLRSGGPAPVGCLRREVRRDRRARSATPRARGASVSRIYARGGKLYLDYVDFAGKRARQATGFAVGNERDARELLHQVEDKVKAHREFVAAAATTPPDSKGPVTVAMYIDRWLERRRVHARSVQT